VADRRALPSTANRLLEREKYLGELMAIFDRTLQVPSRCIVVEGAWGSGRTAMINAGCDLAGQAGCVVLRARGGEDEAAYPLAVLRRFVDGAAIRTDGTDETRRLAGAINKLLNAGQSRGADLEEINPLFHALVLALRQIGPLLLAIDDADESDRQTMAVLQYLVRRLENQQIWVLLSAHPFHPGVGLRPVDAFLTDPETRQFVLESLHSDSVAALLTDYFSHEPDAEFATAFFGATEGVPLFVNALLSSLGRMRILPSAEYAAQITSVPTPKIAQLVLGRLSLHPGEVSNLLQACAVLGEDPDLSVIRDLAELDPADAEMAADAAVRMELLRPGRPLRFASPLIRQSIYQDTPAPRRSELHAKAARILSEHEAPEGIIAEHLLVTQPAGDVTIADWLQEVGRNAMAEDNVDLAHRCFSRALRESSPLGQRGSLRLDLASVEMRKGSPTALDHFRRALELGVVDSAEVTKVAVGLLRYLADMPQLRKDMELAIHGLTDRVDGLNREGRIEFELALSMTSTSSGERSDEIVRLRRLLREPGDEAHPVARLAATFILIHDLAASAVSVDELAPELERSIDAEQLLSSDLIIKNIQTMACFGLLCADRFEVVDTMLGVARARAQQLHDVRTEGRISFLVALSHLWKGSLVEAERESLIGLQLSQQMPAAHRSRPSLGLIDSLFLQGKREEAERVSGVLNPSEFHDATYRAAARVERARLLLGQGQLGESAEEFLEAGAEATAFGIVNPAVNPWRAEASMVLAALGRWEEARTLADEHLVLAWSFGAVRAIGIGLRAKAAATRDLAERTLLLTEAVSQLEQSPARVDAAHALVDLGTVLVATDRKQEAREVLNRAVNLASLCGATHLVEVAGIRLRAAGARPRRLGLVGSSSLTPAELRVARLAAQGMSNQAIATELYVTVKTVEGHLAKSYRKLGVGSRQRLSAALADDRGGLPEEKAV
jgi:DNA-binding CsgD family transcriptional regulator